MKLRKIAPLLLFLLSAIGFAQTGSLQKDIEVLLKDKKAAVGVAIMDSSLKESVSINAAKHLPMQSVYKYPIAIAVLAEVDKGRLKIDQEINITKADLLPDTWSPIRDKYPDGTTLTLAEIIEYTIGQSDNNGCDILLRLVNGPDFVDRYFKKQGFKGIAVKATEEEMHKDEKAQFTNWTTPAEANKILAAYYINKDGKLLSKPSYDFLWNTMKNAVSGPRKLRGQLPKETVVAHKTGLSGTNAAGITTASNDIGIIFLPNGKYFYISVFVSDSKEEEATNEKIIAGIAKLAYDYYNK